jgi:hypothetical protein
MVSAVFTRIGYLLYRIESSVFLHGCCDGVESIILTNLQIKLQCR